MMLFSLPNMLIWCYADLLDSCTLMLMFLPACSLAGAITVVGKPTLGTAVKFGLAAETTVAHLHGQTEEGEEGGGES